MSRQAMAWASRTGKDYELSPPERLTLWAMANYADPEGNDIYPSMPTLVDDTGLSERTLRRNIKHMFDIGIMTMGDQRAVERIPRNKRPTVYKFIYQGRKGGSQTRQPASGTVPGLDRVGVALDAIGGGTGPGTLPPKPIKTKEEPTRAASAFCRECDRQFAEDQLTSSRLCRDCLLLQPKEPHPEPGSGHALVLAQLSEYRAKRNHPSPSQAANTKTEGNTNV